MAKIKVCGINNLSFLKQIIEIAPNVTLQFHGSETEEFCSSFGVPYWKTLPIKNSKDLLNANVYRSADAILLETKSDGSIGGTGKTFDWTILKELDFDSKKYILAGGIGLHNILQANSIGPWCLDINSMIETEPGIKSIEKANEIFKLIADV